VSIFERYLTLWVALCIVAGVALGHVMPGFFGVVAGAEVAKVNLPVAVLIWLMIVPMLLKIDFGAGPGARALARGRRDALHQLAGQALLDGAARHRLHRPRVRADAAVRGPPTSPA
jgi:hypothetical protein